MPRPSTPAVPAARSHALAGARCASRPRRRMAARGATDATSAGCRVHHREQNMKTALTMTAAARPRAGHAATARRRAPPLGALLLTAAALAATAPARAAEAAGADGNHFYYTLGFAGVRASASDCCGTDNRDLGAVALALGWQPIRYLALEATGLAGVLDSTDQGATLKLNSAYLVSVVPMIPLEDFAIYGRVGYSHVTLGASSAFGSASASDHDTAFGVGLQFLQPSAGTRLGGRLEFTRLYNRDALRIDALTISFMQRF